MTLYRLYLLSPLAFAGIANSFKDRRKAFFVLYGVFTFLFFSLRTQFLGSGDAIVYFRLWERLGQIPLSISSLPKVLSADLEKGFLICCWFLSHFFPSGQFVFVFASSIITWALISFYSENCDDYTLAPLMMNGMALTGFILQGTRQAIAIAICLLSYKACKERKLVKFLVILFIAMSFHASALLFVLVYFAYGIKLSWKSCFLVLVIAGLSPIIIERITILANYFMNESYVGGMTELTTGGTVTMALYICLILYCVVVRHKMYFADDENEYVHYSHAFFMLLLSAAFFSMRFFYSTVFERGSYYFLPFAPLAISGTYKRFDEKSQALAHGIFYVIFFLLVLYKSSSGSPLAAYDFFWNVAP